MLKQFFTSPKKPFFVFHAPTAPYLLYLMAKSRSPFFYTACNPIQKYGSGPRASKSRLLSFLPEKYLPRGIVVEAGEPFEAVLEELAEKNLDFPLVAKPNLGERGKGVLFAKNREMLATYLEESQGQVIIQERIDLPLEMGVLYVRYPGEEKGFISSLSMKAMPMVVGDGQSTMMQLIDQEKPLRLFRDHYREIHGTKLDRVLAEKESFILDRVAQQIRGTQFLDAGEHLTPEITAHFDSVFKHIDGLFLGRADIKVGSLADLESGENVKFMEINGTASMPIHIFDPKYSLRQTYRQMIAHWDHIYEISKRNRKLGVRTIGIPEAWGYFKERFFKPVTADKAAYAKQDP